MDDTAGPGSNAAKRARDEPDDSPDAKRLRAADRILLDILEEADPADPADRDSGDLTTVMRSFEEEIAALSPCSQQQPGENPGRSELGFLLEASDDDLGLPPAPDGGEGVGGDPAAGGNPGLAGLGQLWGFEDENPSRYDALGFGGWAQEDPGADGGVAFDGDLFDYRDVTLPGASDFWDFSWLPESLPAV